jgi:hypothetical protein
MINPEIFQFNEVTVVKVNIHEQRPYLNKLWCPFYNSLFSNSNSFTIYFTDLCLTSLTRI